MALYPNGSYMSCSPGRHFGGNTATAGGTSAGLGVLLRNGGARMNRFVSATFSKTASTPDGYGARSPWPAAKAGGIGAIAQLGIATAASGALGLPASGSVSFSIDFAPATGGLISSGTGTATFAIITTATVLATRTGAGAASFAINTNTPLLGALGWVSATGAFSVTTTMQSYARGFMTGSTVDTSTIVNANIVSVNGYSVTGNGQTGSEWGPA